MRSLNAVLLCLPTLLLLGQAVVGDIDGDGDVDLNDLSLIQAAIGASASGSGDPRDLDGDGRITVFDLRRAQLICTRPGCAVEVASLKVDIAPSEMTMLVGQSANFSTSVIVSATNNQSRPVAVVQVVPAGLTVLPGITNAFTAVGTFTQLDNQTLRANALGTYALTVTASSPGLPNAVGTLTVKVVSELDPLQLTIPGTIPSALPLNSTTPVQFSVIASGGGVTPPPSLTVEGVGNALLLTVLDDGAGSDIQAGDLVYTASANVDTGGLSVGQCHSYRARSGTVFSQVYQLCVTSLPVQPSPSDLTIVFNNSGTPVIQNEIVVIVKAGTAENLIQALASSVNATIVGGIPLLKMYQFRLNVIPASLVALNAIITTIKASPIVVDAVTQDVGTGTAVTPTDPSWGGQYGPAKIRADEAWVISRGGTPIGILDTGVDYNHADLIGKVVKGPDFANGDADPFDDGGHGTHVAGIAAANSNNGIGVAGVSWNSKIFAVKVLKGVGGGVGAGVALSVAQGIVYSASLGLRVMNLSLGWPTSSWAAITCPAVAYARFTRGTVVVAAAGNNASSVPLYPGGCLGAFTVGSTTSTDARSGFSNFGSYVSIAAPGTGIVSTVPTGGCGLCDPTGYKSLNGTSMASPHVAGAVAVLISRQPSLSAAAIEDRLKKTAEPLAPALQLGAGRLDLFEAVFNGSFEESSMALWTRVGTVSSIPNLAALAPRHRKRMAFLSSGPAAAQVSATLTQAFTIQPGVTSFPLKFDYTFITEEYPEFVGSAFNDSLTITMVGPGGVTTTLARETVNGSAFTLISGINFPGGDTTTGWTGWKTVSVTIPVSVGPGTYRVFITDAGDGIYDSAVLLDKIQFK